MQSVPKHSIIGVFKGMGDLLWASSVIRAELDRGLVIHLLVFPSLSLIDLCSLIDFGPKAYNLHLQRIPTTLRSLPKFLENMRNLCPNYIWISPHAPVADSSWRIPLLLRLMQTLFWPTAYLIGADSERLSRLFHRRVQVDRTLPLSSREWTAYRQLHSQDLLPSVPPRPRFRSAIMDLRNRTPVYDLVIHPGANASNRVWPADKYPGLFAYLPAHWKIAIVGLPADVAAVLAELPQGASSRYSLLSGTLQETLQTFAAARMAFVMNSGTMHFAEVLRVPTVAIFGQQKSEAVIGEGCIEPVYRQTVPCQPCGHATCGQPQVYCLQNIEPHDVAQRLIFLASTLPRPGSLHTVPYLTSIQRTPS